jgi:hypothetical protein
MVTAASVFGMRAPAMIINNCHLDGQGWTLALTGPRHRLGIVSSPTGDCKGFLLPVVTLIVV